MFDPFKPAAMPDGDCAFIAVSTRRELDTDIRQLRRSWAPRVAVLADRDRVVFIARFKAPCPPRRAVGMALWLSSTLERQHGLERLQVAPLDVIAPMRLTPMDRYRLDLTAIGHMEFPVADLPSFPLMIPRLHGAPMPIIIAAEQGGAA